MPKVKKTHNIDSVGFSKSKMKADPFGGGIDAASYGREKTKNAYAPYRADDNIMDKYRNPLKKKVSDESDNGRAPVRTQTKKKPKKDNLNDSWEKAWDDDVTDPNKFSTYTKPQPKPEPVKQTKLVEEDNFNFNEMKQGLAEENYNFDDDDDNSGESDAKDFEYNFFAASDDMFGAPASNQPNYSQKQAAPQASNNQKGPVVSNNQNNEDDLDFFGGAQKQMTSPPMQKQESNGLGDLFGDSSVKSTPQPSHQTHQVSHTHNNQNDLFQDDLPNVAPVQPPKPKENIFASDPSSVFNANPMMGHNFATANPGYGMYNQNYGMGGQNYGMQDPNSYYTGSKYLDNYFILTGLV